MIIVPLSVKYIDNRKVFAAVNFAVSLNGPPF